MECYFLPVSKIIYLQYQGIISNNGQIQKDNISRLNMGQYQVNVLIRGSGSSLKPFENISKSNVFFFIWLIQKLFRLLFTPR
jgi:hypothetical protein